MHLKIKTDSEQVYSWTYEKYSTSLKSLDQSNLWNRWEGSAGFAKRIQSARPSGQGVWDPARLTLPYPRRKPITGIAKPAAPSHESSKKPLKICSFFDPQKNSKNAPHGPPQRLPKSPKIVKKCEKWARISKNISQNTNSASEPIFYRFFFLFLSKFVWKSMESLKKKLEGRPRKKTSQQSLNVQNHP